MNATMAKIHPELPDKLKNLPDDASITLVEFSEVLGVPPYTFKLLYSQNYIPKVSFKCTMHNLFKSKKYFWKMGIVRSYIKDFDKWVTGEISSSLVKEILI